MVQACYESGKPSLGVGAGNAPVIIDETYTNLEEAVGLIVLSKTFDNGVICASEQSIVAVDSVYDKVVQLFKKRGVHVVEGEDRRKVGEFINIGGHINADIVGQSAKEIAKRCGIEVPSSTIILAAECTEVGFQEPFSGEKLSPCLAFYRVKDFDEATTLAHQLVCHGGKVSEAWLIIVLWMCN
jgi:acetaldehyde dehydrogenase / alcohol dehydrogenase